MPPQSVASALLPLGLLLLPAAASAQRTERDHGERDHSEGELERPDGTLILGAPTPRGPLPRDLDARLARAASLPPEAQLRLGESAAARARRLWSEAYGLRARSLEARERGTREELRREAEALEARARADAEAAIRILTRALARTCDPMTRREAQGLWLLAVLHRDQRQPAEAARVAQRLAERCPTCPVTADALLMMAEQAFDEADLERAVVLYRRVLAHRGARGRYEAYAHFKLAWCAFNLQRYEEAFGELEAARATSRGARGATLKREAAHDQLRALSLLGRSAAEQLRIVRSLSPDGGTEASLIERYLRLLVEAGQESEAAAFRAALGTDPH